MNCRFLHFLPNGSILRCKVRVRSVRLPEERRARFAEIALERLLQ
jgi:hypothetical protein